MKTVHNEFSSRLAVLESAFLVLLGLFLASTVIEGRDLNQEQRTTIVGELADSLSSNSFVGIIEFKTSTRGVMKAGANGKPDRNSTGVSSKTGAMVELGSSKGKFHIEGKFRVIKEIRSPVPDLGEVTKDVPADVLGTGPQDEVTRNIAPLIPGAAGNDEKEFVARPQYYIATGISGVTEISKIRFIGPLPRNEVNDIDAVVSKLAGRALTEISESEANELRTSKNLWLQALAVLRLRS